MIKTGEAAAADAGIGSRVSRLVCCSEWEEYEAMILLCEA